MSFRSHLTRHPIAFDPDRGADALAVLPDIAPDLRPLVEGAAGCSPFLAGLMKKEAAWLQEAFEAEPKEICTQILTMTGQLDARDLNAGLRQLKRRVALYTGLADLGGVWALEDVTEFLTDFADAATDIALKTHLAALAKRGQVADLTEDEARAGAGAIVISMGKGGAHELNYSSDIDLICLFDETRFDPRDDMEARAGYIKATRRMAASLGDVTGDGYVFRTDLRLRPDASVTPVSISTAAALRYYESEGRNWERAAYIKARAAAGDIRAGERFLKALTPFVWRRHLDFAAIQDTQDMREKIRHHKGLTGPIALEKHNIKLGKGGIREIEFFAQTRQIVSGGRDQDLRLRGTVPALRKLTEKGWLDASTTNELIQHYRHHREIEHRLQMINDAQTHSLPGSVDGMTRLANFCGEGDVGRFRKNLEERLAAVDNLCEPFYQHDPSPAPEISLPESTTEIIARWPGYPALRSPRGQEIFARLRPDLLAHFAATPRPEEALSNFDGFLRGLPAGVQLFSLFEANPPLVDLIVDICGTAPGLSRYLSRNSGVLDAVIGGGFFAEWPGADKLLEDIQASFAGQDFEGVLNQARLWKKDWHFRVGVHHLRGLITAEEAGAQYSQLAAAILQALWPRVCDDVARRHGPAPGRGGAVVAMGSLGAGRLTAGSDLDLLVIYDADGVEFSDGPRPLNARGWFAKATKTLITALSAPTGEGKLYDVDMRLRPSGRQGPVATSLEAFETYQLNDAWTWEHLALTRARPIAGDAGLLADVEAVRARVLGMDRAAEKIAEDVQDMRARLAAAGRTGGSLADKEGAGAMKDIELIAEMAALLAGAGERSVVAQLGYATQLGWIEPDEVTALSKAHQHFGRLDQAARLLTDRALDLEEIGLGGQNFVLRETDVGDVADLVDQTAKMRHDMARLIEAALQSPPTKA